MTNQQHCDSPNEAAHEVLPDLDLDLDLDLAPRLIPRLRLPDLKTHQHARNRDPHRVVRHVLPGTDTAPEPERSFFGIEHVGVQGAVGAEEPVGVEGVWVVVVLLVVQDSPVTINSSELRARIRRRGEKLECVGERTHQMFTMTSESFSRW